MPPVRFTGSTRAVLIALRLEFLWACLHDHYTGRVVGDVLRGLCQSSTHQYSSCWKVSLVSARFQLPPTVSEAVVFQFLFVLFCDKGRALSMIACHLSVLGNPLFYSFGISLLQSLVDLMQNGFFLQWPPHSGQSCWSFHKVLDLLPSDKYIICPLPDDLLHKFLFLIVITMGFHSS